MNRPLPMPIALLLAMTAAPAFAWEAPKGCEIWLTVQSRGCYAANYFKCDGDAAGEQWRADFDQQGIFFQSRIDVETQWLESIEINPRVTQTLDPAPRDPANFSSLLATGRDDFEFSLSKDNGEHSNVKGFDQTEFATIEIDGITLTKTRFEYVETDDAGNILRQARGDEYIHPEWRLFFSGTSEYWTDKGWMPMVGDPVEFILPGEKGFGLSQPVFDCDAVMSGLEMPPMPPKS
jgi:hypothetical protein